MMFVFLIFLLAYIVKASENCFCSSQCDSLADPYVTKFDGVTYNLFVNGTTTLYKTSNFEVKAYIDPFESLFYQKRVIIENENKILKDISIENCYHANQIVYNGTSYLNNIHTDELLNESVNTIVKCKFGPLNCFNRDETCTYYLDVYIKKNNEFLKSSSLNIETQTFYNLEQNILKSKGDCFVSPSTNNPNRLSSDPQPELDYIPTPRSNCVCDKIDPSRQNIPLTRYQDKTCGGVELQVPEEKKIPNKENNAWSCRVFCAWRSNCAGVLLENNRCSYFSKVEEIKTRENSRCFLKPGFPVEIPLVRNKNKKCVGDILNNIPSEKLIPSEKDNAASCRRYCSPIANCVGVMLRNNKCTYFSRVTRISSERNTKCFLK